jgi:hypothetical protein
MPRACGQAVRARGAERMRGQTERGMKRAKAGGAGLRGCVRRRRGRPDAGFCGGSRWDTRPRALRRRRSGRRRRRPVGYSPRPARTCALARRADTVRRRMPAPTLPAVCRGISGCAKAGVEVYAWGCFLEGEYRVPSVVRFFADCRLVMQRPFPTGDSANHGFVVSLHLPQHRRSAARSLRKKKSPKPSSKGGSGASAGAIAAAHTRSARNSAPFGGGVSETSLINVRHRY